MQFSVKILTLEVIMPRKSVLLLMVVLLLTSRSVAQQTTGNLEGRIMDPELQPLQGVEVVVASPSLQGTRGTMTNEEGFLRILALPPGLYTVSTNHVGYHERVYNDVAVSLGRTTTLGEVKLTPRTIEMPEIVVSHVKPLIDPFSTTIGANLSPEVYETLPVERDYRNIATLLPHANVSYLGDETNFAGSTGMENKYFIDGVDVTDPYRGITATSLPYNFVKQLEVRTGSYEAEYRSSLGGVLNVITYSGGNEFTGQVFGFFANNRFAREPRQGALKPAKGAFSQYDVGFVVGGPIVRDRLWFSAAYNPKFESEDVEIPGTGFHEDNIKTHSFAAKLTWHAVDNHSLFVSFFGDPTQRRSVGKTHGNWGTPSSFTNPDPYLEHITTGGTNLSLIGHHLLSANLLLESSFSRIVQWEKNLPATNRGLREPLFIDNATGIWSGGAPDRLDNTSVQTSVGIKATFLLGDHALKAGVEYKENILDNNWVGIALFRNGPTSYVDFLLSKKGTVSIRIPSAFVQDTWSLTERLTLSVGMRWDGQYLVGSDRKVAQTITDQFQPRIGFVYQPVEIGLQKIYGSFGRYYQEFSTYLLTSYFLDSQIFRFSLYDHDPRIDPSGATIFALPSEIHPAIEGLEGQYYDEFTLGFDRQIQEDAKLGARGIFRTLRQGIEDGEDPQTGKGELGNPGKGALRAFPRMKREYFALELTLEKIGGGKFNYLVSYVLSRNYGNYPGIFNSDFDYSFPLNASYDKLDMLTNATGLLPNDRTHVFKLSGSYRFEMGLTAGASFVWQSGTPLSEFGGSKAGWPWPNFMQQRGTAGRTPSLWDLSVRFVYDLSQAVFTTLKPRLILDVFHVASQRTPVAFNEVHYFNLDENGNQINRNPIYGLATRYQPPMSMRLGMELNF